MINKVILIGNLGRDPEVRMLEGGVAVGNFPIATNENYKDKSGNWQTRTEWHDIVAWRQLAENLESRMSKGTLVYVEGKLSSRKYTDKDGIERYKTDVVASTIRVIDRKNETSSGGPGMGASSSGNSQSASDSGSQGSDSEELDDLPF
jgi:single-strand DNA-binding protein